MVQLIGRDEEVSSIVSRLTGGRGLLLVGEAGVGKSHLAAAVSSVMLTHGWAVEWIVGSPSIRTVSFGAVQHLLGQVPGSSSQLPAIAAERHLRAKGDQVLLVVDDIDGIDDGSAAVVQSVAMAGVVVLATVRRDAAAHTAVLSMWKDELLERVDIDAIDVGHTGTLAAEFLGGPLESAAVDELATLTLGNPLFVREVLADARSIGSLHEHEGRWVLDARLSAHGRVADILAGRFRNLGDGDRAALELVAIGEPLPVAALERATTTHRLEELERLGLIAMTRVGAVDVVRTSHPLVGEVVRSSTTDIGIRGRSTLLAGAILDDPDPRPADLVRAVGWSLDGDITPPPDTIAMAAAAALTTFDGSTARRFIEASESPDSTTLTMLGRSLLLEHEPHEALAALARAENAAATDAERAAASVARAEVLLFALGDGDGASEVLTRALDEVDTPDARAALVGVVMLSAALGGDFASSLDLGRPLLADATLGDLARLSVLRMTTLAQLVTGQVDELDDDLDTGIALAKSVLESDPVTHVLLQVTRWVWALDRVGVSEARQIVMNARHDPARPAGLTALDDSTLALLALFAGDGDEAARCAALALTDPSGEVVGMGSLLRALSAWINASCGNDDLAMSMHDAALGHPQTSARESAYLGYAQAAVLANRGDLDGAIDECRRAAAASGELRLWAIWLLHFAVRLGRVDAVRDEMEAEQQFIGTAFTGVMIEHAGALADGSPVALSKVADEFLRHGATLFAAEAYAQAAGVIDDEQEAARVAQRAWTCFDRCTGVVSIAMDGLDRPLSVREGEVARLAASGITSREIAEQLFVSQRTIDNHLRSVYRAFGVGQRADLTPLFA